MKRFKYTCALKCAVILVSFLAVTNCGGGGGGGAAAPGTPAPVVLSGTVQAPAGSVAFCPPTLMEKLQKTFIPSAYAAVTGISAVPNGTVVELARIDSAGNTLKILATTVVSAGTYSFNLTALGLVFSSDLVVQVQNKITGARMRAFATSETVNIDPVSEAAVDMVLEKIAANPGSSLVYFTTKELEDFVGSIHVLTTAQQMAAALDIGSTVTVIKTASAGDANIAAFLASASAAGQSADGPGDVGNYFPTTIGSIWCFTIKVTETGKSDITYTDTLKITGTQVFNGIQTTVFHRTNPSNSGVPYDDYRAVNSTGQTYYGDNDPSDTATPQVAPYAEVRFPLRPGTSYEQFNKTGLNFGQDLDYDGKNETFSIRSVVTTAGFETVSVPSVGTFPNSVRIETAFTLVVTLSRSGNNITETGLDTSWYAPGVGQVKAQTNYVIGNLTKTLNYELTAYSANGKGGYSFLAKWGTYGTGDGQFDNPEGIAIDSSDNVYVSDWYNHRIQKFSSTGQFITQWGTYGTGDGQFNYPFGVVLDSSGNVYVADVLNYRIQKFSSTGQFITQWGTYGTGDGQFDHPLGIAVDSSSNVYVADYNNHRVQKFSSSGQFITKWGTYGTGDGQFNHTYGVASDSLGNIYVTDEQNQRIQKFSSSGQFITKWATSGAGDGQLFNPRLVAVDSLDNVYVVDSGNQRIQKFTSTGQFITKWGTYGTDDGQFWTPAGIAFDSQGNAYVTDEYNRRIQVFAP